MAQDFGLRKMDNFDSGNEDAFDIPSDLNLVTSEADRVTPGRASISGALCIPGRSRSGARGLRWFDGMVLSRESIQLRVQQSRSRLIFKARVISGSLMSTKTHSIRFKWGPGLSHCIVLRSATNCWLNMTTHVSCARFP